MKTKVTVEQSVVANATLHGTAGAASFRTIMRLIMASFFAVAVIAASVREDSVRPIEVEGIENVWRISENLISGGDPGEMRGLRRLRDLGVRSIVSVDGSAPRVEIARELGIRYVHIPVGYDGIHEDAKRQLTRCTRELPKPIYVHCHHGKHRGPAAAAMMARADLGWTADEALAYMKRAGTSTDYPGLFDSVKAFEKAASMEASGKEPPLPERVQVADMVEMMVKIDERFDRLKAWQKSKQGLSGAADAEAIQEAIQLRELVRESARLPECRDEPPEFSKTFVALEHDLTDWIVEMKSIEETDKSKRTERLTALIKRAAGRCVYCHRSYRDR